MGILTHVEMVGRSLARRYFPRRTIPTLDYDPYDKAACATRASALLGRLRKEPDQGPLATCQRLLAIADDSYPTEDLASEYFANLELVLGAMPRLETPGQLVIGLGPGRCGSTSLSAMLGTVANSCCTHETPPTIAWDPRSEQVDFHVKRFGMLIGHYSLVSDVSHWWLNSIERIFEHFPDAKAIGLIRDPDECAKSFMPIQGFGKGSFNPWAARGNGIWRQGQWDPTYPSYAPPSYAAKNPDRAKLELITRYVKAYNAQLENMAAVAPERVKLVRTEDLSRDTIQAEIFAFAKAHGETSAWRLNVRGTADGKENQIIL